MRNEIFKEARNELISYLRQQLIGPLLGPEEYIENDSPHKRYLMGILFPPATRVDEVDESHGGESTTEAVNNDSRPSSIAVSFIASANSCFSISVEAGRYRKICKNEWKRYPLTLNTKVDLCSDSSRKQLIFDDLARLDIVIRPYLGSKIITISLSNQAKSGERLDPEKCLFQCGISINIARGEINEYPTSDRFKLDEEQNELALIYRHRVTWAVGHGIAVDWKSEKNNPPIELHTSAMPCYEVHGFSTDLDTDKYSELDSSILNIPNIANSLFSNDEKLLSGFENLIRCYQGWIDELEHEVLVIKYGDAKKRVIERLRKTAERMLRGIKKLRSSSVSMQAFRLANKAMLMQMVHSGKEYAGEAKERNWGYQVPDYFSETIRNNYKWRPFQLAFQLLVLESLIPEEESGQAAESRDEVDLLWFPTGGGKTEAYLAVAAWEMIYRRITKGEQGGGTAIIKRYTLRLLTSQQFQRAGSLICALETIRRESSFLGTEPFSLGLWAGEGLTPNKFSDANDKFNLVCEADEPENCFQLQSCPWCGTEIIPKRFSDDKDSYGIRSNPSSKFEFFCPSQECDFHSHLPIQVIDQALYKSPPSMLIGTVDKFARLTWTAEASAFFGEGKKCPPSLIIQDELHLISGPLGTIAGIYEAGFDSIMEVMGAAPKVIAATATIRSAAQQVNRLFGRKVNIFPPSGVNEADSFFSKEDTTKPGRMYVGVMPSGHTGHTSLIQTAAAILQAPVELGFKSEILDSYWTLPVYHNSRRELGKTMTLARDDIPERIKVISVAPRMINSVEELSAGVKGSRIPEILAKLGNPIPDAIDVLPCTNMISVGVDISRLGMMIITGQPKTTAEYIQASSRVGRDKKRPPGIVIIQYAPTKPRDRSHYETFKSYHQALYRYVEPTSVTPWAIPAMERALHAALIATVRMSGYLKLNESAKYFDATSDEFKKIRAIFEKRIRLATEGMDSKEVAQIFSYLNILIDEWQSHVNDKKVTHFETSHIGKVFNPLFQSFDGNHELAWKTLNSMRNVDTETSLRVRGEKQ